MAVTPAVREAFENHVKLLESQNTAGHVRSESEDSFFVADLNEVVQKWAVWRKALPDVSPFFGMYLTALKRLCASASCGP